MKEVDGFQSMCSGMLVLEDPFGTGLTESTTARRWWEKLDLDVLGKELDGTLCGQGQFICSVTGLHLPHLGHFQFGRSTTIDSSMGAEDVHSHSVGAHEGGQV